MERKVVITGMGVVTPVGIGVPAFSESLKRGTVGAGDIRSFDASGFPVKTAFEVKDFNARRFGTQALDPFIQFAVAAADEAVHDAGFHREEVDPYRVAISVSSSKGGMHTLDRFRLRLERNPSAILGARVYSSSVPNFAAQWIARRWKVQGPAKCYVAACATGTAAVIEGARMVAAGTADYCIAGASDASIVPLMLAGYRQMRVLSPDGGMFPFDRRRKGFLVGEGAGIVFLETPESAKARKARIYGEILGFGYGSDAGQNGIHFQEEENALARTIRRTLETSRLADPDVNYINLHGTATPAGDLYETRQMKACFSGLADTIPMSSTKSMTGHMLGASGAVEIIASLIAMNEGFLPPTAGLENPDPECDLDYVARSSRSARIRTALSVSMGFGGHIAVIALGRH